MLNKQLIKIGENAVKAANLLSLLKEKTKNKVLKDFLIFIKKEKNKIINANKVDIEKAKKNKISENLINRLLINEKKINSIIHSVQEVIKFKDPTHKIVSKWKRPNGLIINKYTVPIGVIGVIYEARPNVTADVATLCFKSGNAVILRGGSEALMTNKVISELFIKALKKNKIDENCVQLIKNTDRKLVDYLLSKMDKYINVIIPRGGKNLVKKVLEMSSVPIIGHLEGLCHVYIDKYANLASRWNHS